LCITRIGLGSRVYATNKVYTAKVTWSLSLGISSMSASGPLSSLFS